MPKLTARVIDATTRDVWCSQMPGFGVLVHPTGRKVFVARYRTQSGRQRKLTLGRASDLSVDQARDMAREAFAAVARGDDPAAERRDARQGATLADLRDRYLAEHAQPYKKPSSVRHDVRNWARLIKAWGAAQPVQSVTRADVQALHASMHATRVTANHCRALISKAWGLAARWGWHHGPNPATGAPRYRIPRRERVLSIAQLAAMDAAIGELVAARQIPRAAGDLFRLLALTGCRLREIMHARRDWVDVERRVLLLPDSKVGPRIIMLPERAVAIIQTGPTGPWLTPGKLAGQPLRTPYIAWARVLARAGLPADTRIHDLRHTFGSHGHRQGLTQRQIADLLGHSDLATTARYVHGVADGERPAVDVVADRLASGWSDSTLAP